MAKKRTAGKLDQIAARKAEADQLQSTISWLKSLSVEDLSLNRAKLHELNTVDSWYFKPGGGEPVIGDAADPLPAISVLGPRVDTEITSQEDLYQELVGWWLPDAERQLARTRAKVEW